MVFQCHIVMLRYKKKNFAALSRSRNGAGAWRRESCGGCLLACMAAIFAALAGCAATTKRTIAVQVDVLDTMRRYERVYLLQPGDEVEVFINRHPELSRKLVVRPDGYITVPLVDDVRATDRTPHELAAQITHQLAARLVDPEISVIVDNPPEPMVYVVGDVGGSRPVSFRQAKTVAQAISLAGGVLKSGSYRNVNVIRLNKDGFLEARAIKLEGTGWRQPEAYMAMQNMALAPYDIVLVPESSRSRLVRLAQDLGAIVSPYFQIRLLQLVSEQH